MGGHGAGGGLPSLLPRKPGGAASLRLTPGAQSSSDESRVMCLVDAEPLPEAGARTMCQTRDASGYRDPACREVSVWTAAAGRVPEAHPESHSLLSSRVVTLHLHQQLLKTRPPSTPPLPPQSKQRETF